MATHKTAPARFAICIEHGEYAAALELHKLYRVLPDKEAERDGDLRIVDESGEDYLYPAEWFVPVRLPAASAKTLKKSYLRAMAKVG